MTECSPGRKPAVSWKDRVGLSLALCSHLRVGRLGQCGSEPEFRSHEGAVSLSLALSLSLSLSLFLSLLLPLRADAPQVINRAASGMIQRALFWGCSALSSELTNSENVSISESEFTGGVGWALCAVWAAARRTASWLELNRRVARGRCARLLSIAQRRRCSSHRSSMQRGDSLLVPGLFLSTDN